MPYIQPQSNNPTSTAYSFGMMPVSNAIGETQVNPYLVSSTESAIYAGDIAVVSSLGTVKSLYTAGGTYTATSVNVGVFANSLAAGAGSTAARVDITSSQVAYVYDSPTQLFVMTDTSSASINSTMVGKSFAVLATGFAGAAISSVVNRSVQALSGTTASSAGAVRILKMHPIEQNVWATAATGVASVRRWIVQFANHIYAPGVQVGGVVTT